MQTQRFMKFITGVLSDTQVVTPIISELAVDEYNFKGHVPFDLIIESHAEIFILSLILQYLISNFKKK